MALSSVLLAQLLGLKVSGVFSMLLGPWGAGEGLVPQTEPTGVEPTGVEPPGVELPGVGQPASVCVCGG